MKTSNKIMRTIKENLEDKAGLYGDIYDFISALENPIEEESDGDATLCVVVRESGVRTTRLYSKYPVALLSSLNVGDGTIHETGKLLLDKATKECLVDALKGRLETLKKEIKGLI